MRQSIRLYNWSDLHLERNDFDYRKAEVDYFFINILTLTGDISNPQHKSFYPFFDYVSKKFNHVIYIAGNHEYHSKNLTYSETRRLIKRILKQFPNVHFLDNDLINLYGYIFIGSTLWSYVPSYCHETIQNSDYNYIKWDSTNLITPTIINQLNAEAVKFIETSLIENEGKPCIILSHHAPLFTSLKSNVILANPIFANETSNFIYHNHLIKLFKSPLYMWIFGHTHYRNCLRVNNVILWTHQYGYTGEIAEEYNFNLFIELKINI